MADLASAFDAGLTPADLGALPGQEGREVLARLLAERGVRVPPLELEVLTAAWDAGRIAEGLRRRSRIREQRAQLCRDVLTGIRYPVLLMLVALPVAALVGMVAGDARIVTVAAGALVLGVAAGTWLGLALRRGSNGLLRLPLLGPLLRDLAELPYLEVLHGLYAAGVPILTAHARAVAACPQPAVRADLERADRILHANQPLAVALGQAGALHAETRSLVAVGERAGGLEEALARALERRSQVAARSAARAARVLGTALYILAAASVLLLAVRFYSAYFANLRAMMR